MVFDLGSLFGCTFTITAMVVQHCSLSRFLIVNSRLIFDTKLFTIQSAFSDVQFSCLSPCCVDLSWVCFAGVGFFLFCVFFVLCCFCFLFFCCTFRVSKKHISADNSSILICFYFRPLVFKGRKEMFYIAIHSIHFILRLYGVGYIIVNDLSDSERGNLMSPLHGLLFPISSIVIYMYIYASSHRQDNTHYGLYYTSRGALAETRNSFMISLKIL